MIMWRIKTKTGVWLGDYVGTDPAHALLLRHKRDGYQGLKVSKGRIVWTSELIRKSCGDVDDFDIVPAPVTNKRCRFFG